VHPEEAEVVAGPQPGHNQLLLGPRGRGLFEHGLDLVEPLPAGHPLAPHGAEVGQHMFAGGLHGRHAAGLRLGRGYELLDAPSGRVAHKQVIAHEVDEGLVGGEGPGPLDGIAVATGLGLGDEREARGGTTGGRAIGGLVAGLHDDGHGVGSGGGGLLDHDLDRGLGLAVAIDEPLERHLPVVLAGGGNDSAFELHEKRGAEDLEIT